MPQLKQHFQCLIRILINTAAESVRYVTSLARSRSVLVAENLFLRKQLAFYQERQARPRRLTDAARFSLALWSHLFNWKDALVIVKPETLIRWHRKGFKLFWRWKSRAGRPRLPETIRKLIVQMVRENPTWGQERVADELSVKLGVCVSPRTVRAYWPVKPGDRDPKKIFSQRWSTFVRNHAQAILACDFLVSVTAGFRVLYVFVVMEIGTRRILHFNVTAHPTAAWTLQQFREAIPSDHSYTFIIHDRDSIFSAELDKSLNSFGLKVLRTPVQSPKANAYCERLIGTIRRECLDYMIPLSEKHLRKVLREWVSHYNRGRPHASLGPEVPEPEPKSLFKAKRHRHELPPDCRIRAKDVLAGLHHEYSLEREAA